MTEAESTVLISEIDVDEEDLQDQLDDLDVNLATFGHGTLINSGDGLLREVICKAQ